MTLPPDWKLPPGVSRSLWEFAHDRQIARDEERHLRGSLLLEFDRRILEKWFPGPGKVVDLGCGTGRLLVDFARRAWTGVGVDLSHESLRVAHEALAPLDHPMALLRANLCQLDCLPEASFDAALLMFGTLGMVEGRENRRAVLWHTQRMLKRDGKLALHVHNLWRHLFLPDGRRWLWRDLARRLIASRGAGDTEHDYRGIPRMYHHVFTLREIRRLLTSVGFRTVETVPLAPEADSGATRDRQDPSLRGAWTGFRATGWLILAEKSSA
jgi:ubiquinone/menaquinone biosynthesis C-methylase UbiE